MSVVVLSAFITLTPEPLIKKIPKEVSVQDRIPIVLSINISKGGIPKLPVSSIRVSFAGLEGDGHNHEKHRTPMQAVCLQDIERIEDLSGEGYSLTAGSTGENLTVRNLHVNALPIGTILKFAGGVILEISKIRKPCYVMDAIHPQLKSDSLGRHGMYAKVLQEGVIAMGDRIYSSHSNSLKDASGPERDQ